MFARSPQETKATIARLIKYDGLLQNISVLQWLARKWLAWKVLHVRLLSLPEIVVLPVAEITGSHGPDTSKLFGELRMTTIGLHARQYLQDSVVRFLSGRSLRAWSADPVSGVGAFLAVVPVLSDPA